MKVSSSILQLVFIIAFPFIPYSQNHSSFLDNYSCALSIPPPHQFLHVSVSRKTYCIICVCLIFLNNIKLQSHSLFYFYCLFIQLIQRSIHVSKYKKQLNASKHSIEYHLTNIPQCPCPQKRTPMVLSTFHMAKFNEISILLHISMCINLTASLWHMPKSCQTPGLANPISLRAASCSLKRTQEFMLQPAVARVPSSSHPHQHFYIL